MRARLLTYPNAREPEREVPTTHRQIWWDVDHERRGSSLDRLKVMADGFSPSGARSIGSPRSSPRGSALSLALLMSLSARFDLMDEVDLLLEALCLLAAPPRWGSIDNLGAGLISASVLRLARDWAVLLTPRL